MPQTLYARDTEMMKCKYKMCYIPTKQHIHVYISAMQTPADEIHKLDHPFTCSFSKSTHRSDHKLLLIGGKRAVNYLSSVAFVSEEKRNPSDDAPPGAHRTLVDGRS
jgi:hypothetical protein